MPSFVVTSVVLALYEPVRIPADRAGQKGFNVYHATLPLQFSEIPVCIAHRTLRNRCPPGTVARIRGTAVVEGRSLLIYATTLIPAAIESVPGFFSLKHFCLPRVILDGFVASKIRTLSTNAECLVFDVTIVRPDVWPGIPMVVSCWINRDRYRFHLLEDIVANTPVVITGAVCGWTFDDKLMVDVHTLAFNNSGSAPTAVATDMPNPFSRAEFKDGFAVFPFPRYDKSRIRSVLSMDALPSKVAMYVAASRNPRLAKAPRLPNENPYKAQGISPLAQNGSSTEEDSPPAVVDVTIGEVPMDVATAEELPSVEEVRAAAIKKVRARVTRARKSQRLSSADEPFSQQVKLKISRKQLATIQA